tara:strand:+ start:91 stop:279 length:189 start_codon:yes stop_codon:yes gene_type:complete
MSEEQSLKEKLVEYANEYEYTVSVGSLRTEAEIQSDIQRICNKLGWTLEEAQDYADFIERRY